MIGETVNTKNGKGVIVGYSNQLEIGPDGWFQFIVYVKINNQESSYWECELS